MDSNSNPVLKLPTFRNTRVEIEGVISEREKMEAELRELEAHMYSFEDSILKRGGPYFGRVAQGVSKTQIIDGINNELSKVKNENGCTESSSESDKERIVKDTERVFSLSSKTSPASVNKKDPDEMATLSPSSFAKRP